MSFLSEYRDLVTKYLPQPLTSETRYRRTLRQLEQLMVPRPSRAQSMLIEVLSTLVEEYERNRYPAGEVAPAEMLAHCIETRETAAAVVAKETAIPLSTISDVLAGRRGLSKANAQKLAAYFRTPVAAFL